MRPRAPLCEVAPLWKRDSWYTTAASSRQSQPMLSAAARIRLSYWEMDVRFTGLPDRYRRCMRLNRSDAVSSVIQRLMWRSASVSEARTAHTVPSAKGREKATLSGMSETSSGTIIRSTAPLASESSGQSPGMMRISTLMSSAYFSTRLRMKTSSSLGTMQE